MRIKQKIYHFLRQSEKYTKTDMVYLVKGGSWLTLGQIISAASAFLLSVAFANLLPQETYGNYKYILSLLGILTIFSLPGLGTAIIQAVARGYEGSFYQAFRIKLKWGCLGSLTAIVLGGYYWYQGNTDLPVPLFLSALFLPLMQASQIYAALLGGRKLFSYQVKYSTATRLFSVATMIAALFLTNNLIWIIAVYLVSNTLANLFFYFFTKSKFQPNKKEDQQTISYGKHLSLVNIINTIASYLDRLLVFHYLGAIELAIYSFAITPPEQIKRLLKNIDLLALPQFAQRSKEEIKSTIFKKVKKFIIFILPLIGLYILLAPFLYEIFFPQYLNSIFYSQVFSLSLLGTLAVLVISALKSQGAKKQLYQLNIYSSLIQIILLFFFMHFYGLWGIILARILSQFIGLSLSLILIRKI
jgi:O-antigen/teichoic acid export membrane protein